LDADDSKFVRKTMTSPESVPPLNALKKSILNLSLDIATAQAKRISIYSTMICCDKTSTKLPSSIYSKLRHLHILSTCPITFANRFFLFFIFFKKKTCII
jgi:hypothetical protein